MKRRLLLAGAFVSIVALGGGFPGRAMADAPSQEGWWTSANATGSLGLTGAGTSASPDVPSGGLLVEGGPGSASGNGDTGAVAYAGLLYELAQGDTATTLTLTVAPQSATTPTATLQLCPLTVQGFRSEAGGPMSDAPPYDCTTGVTAAQTSNAYEFNVSSLAANGALAIAILPTSPTDRVVLSKPDDQSLQVKSGTAAITYSPPATSQPSTTDYSAAAPPATTNGAPSEFGTGVNAPLSSSSPASDSGFATRSSPSPAFAQANPTPSRTAAGPITSAPVATNPGYSQLASASPGSNEAFRPLVGLLFLAAVLVALALWMSAGHSSASPPHEA